jgi:hypothetical protein
MTDKTVLYFEDTEAFAEVLVPILNSTLDGFAVVERFVAIEESDKMYDARLEEEILSRMANGADIAFILSDADLAKIKLYRGLSDANVSKVANKLGIPAAFYSSNLTGIQFLKADQGGDGRILLDRSNPTDMAEEVSCLVRGFSSILDKLNAIIQVPSASRPQDSATLLATLIGRPDIKNRIKLYLSGDQRVGAELLSSPDHHANRQAAIFGTLIYDSLLKYPGITVNSVAAASYLNISVDEFQQQEVRSVFASAIYNGPFSSSSRVLWWRDVLDDLLLEADADDGRALVLAKIGRQVSPCVCSESGVEPAGYYCMITGRPVSEEYSKGGISWFPPGADLAKIAESKYDELAPWLAI